MKSECWTGRSFDEKDSRDDPEFGICPENVDKEIETKRLNAADMRRWPKWKHQT